MQNEPRLDTQEIWSIYHLIRREWFGRLWIRQGIGLGEEEEVLQRGRKQIRWRSFCNAIFVLYRKPIIGDIFDAAQQQTFRVGLGAVDAVVLYSRRRFSFSNLRRQIQTSKCQDPRDRIYGVLGLLRESDRFVLIPDYTKSVTEVYAEATKKYIEHSGSLHVLNQCGSPALTSSRDLPSWVPDWSGHMPSSPVHAVFPPVFDLFRELPTIDDDVLCVRGIPCDVVSYVTHVYKHLKLDADLILVAQELQTLLLEADKIEALRNAFNSRDHMLEAFTRTLWADNFGDRWVPTSPHEPVYDDCLSLVRTLIEPDLDAMQQSFMQQSKMSRCLDGAHSTCTGRILFATRDGRIGLAPASLAEGNEICLLTGCSKPIALQPVSSATVVGNARYKIVGESYFHGMMFGETLLGGLPDHLRGLLDADSLRGLRGAGFVDIRTSTICQDDPRIKPFLAGLVDKGLLLNPTIEEFSQRGALDVLVTAGYPIQVFNLF